MRKFSVVTALILVTVGCMNVASATPPSGQFSFTDHGRGTVGENATVEMPGGTDIVYSDYTLASGASTGWRDQPGSIALVVTKGELAVSQAEGCATKKFGVGQATVVAPGMSMFANSGQEPATFLAAFVNLPAGSTRPLIDGDSVAAPSGCVSAAGVAASGTTAGEALRGTFVTLEAGYGGHPPSAEVSNVQAGKDIFFTTYKLEPGFSAGWHTHTDVIAIMKSGTLTYYEGHDGKCVKTGEYKPGEAYFVLSHPGHGHLAVNEGSETVEVVGVYFNVPKKYGAVPTYGNQMDALDFSPMPSPDCPKLRSPDSV